MLLPFALLAAAVLHDPTPDDVHRFGFAVRPVGESVPRQVWNETRCRLYESESPVSQWLIYGREAEYADWLADVLRQERIWGDLDDMARDSCSPTGRVRAARRLKERLGPVAYYLGCLP